MSHLGLRSPSGLPSHSKYPDIYILNLHGNSKKKEKAPDGGEDKNVFDIQQGVAICIMVRRPKKAQRSDAKTTAERKGRPDEI